MKGRHHVRHLWLVLAAYGVWFAVLSGLEEISHGKYWKAELGLVLGIVVYIIIERKQPKK